MESHNDSAYGRPRKHNRSRFGFCNGYVAGSRSVYLRLRNTDILRAQSGGKLVVRAPSHDLGIRHSGSNAKRRVFGGLKPDARTLRKLARNEAVEDNN